MHPSLPIPPPPRLRLPRLPSSAPSQELHDPLALLLMLRINGEGGLALARRRLPALDAYFDRVNLLLWPRLKSLLDAQLASVKAVHPGALLLDPGGGGGGGAPRVLALTGQPGPGGGRGW